MANVRGQGTRHLVTGTLDPLVLPNFIFRGIEREGTGTSARAGFGYTRAVGAAVASRQRRWAAHNHRSS